MSSLRYVALGDSYTIGTSIRENERWPDQLVRRLAGGLPPDRAPLVLAANLGANGFASQDVIDVELPLLDALRPEFVSLLVGVNDVVRGVDPVNYARNAERIVDDLVRRVGATRMVVLATPDYTVTPAGADFGDATRRSAEIDAVNAAMAALADARRIAFVDIVDASRRALQERSLVARDGLHPSGRQYRAWVDQVEPVVRRLLAT